MVKYVEKINIKTLEALDRPREKLLIHGARSLSDAELLAILIGSGSTRENAVELCQRILATYGNDLLQLSDANIQDMCGFLGMGKAKAVSITAALELGRRRKESFPEHKTVITSSKSVFELMSPVFADLPHEEFWVLILNAANKVKCKVMISRGGLTGTVADPKIIFRKALEHKAAYIILTHNHPSGNLKASQEDILITKKLIEAGRLLDLQVLDHLIFADESYYSMADEGII